MDGKYKDPFFLKEAISRSRRTINRARSKPGSNLYLDIATGDSDFHFSATACVCATRLGRLGKPFIHFFLVGEQLLDARALLHTLEMREQKGKRGRESFHFCFGRPRGCSVASSPSCFAMPIIQSSLSKGRPRWVLDRRSSSSDVLSGSLSNSIQFCGRSIGHELKNSMSFASCRATR